MAKSTFPERRSALAAARDGTGTNLTESWFLDPAASHELLGLGRQAADDPHRLGGRPPAAVEGRDDDRGADRDQDDERADPEDAAPDPLFDLALGHHADVAKRAL